MKHIVFIIYIKLESLFYCVNCFVNMNFDDYEQLPTPSVTTNMTAGAIAGVLEHCIMYPMDSIKVRNKLFY